MIKLYDIRTKSAIQNIIAHDNSVTSIDFHPSKKYIVSCSLDSTIKIWDLFQNALLYTLYGHEGPIYSINFNKNGEFICSGGIDGDVYLWRNNLEGKLIDKKEDIKGGLSYPELKKEKSESKYKINLRSKSSNKVRINKRCLNNMDYPTNLNNNNDNKKENIINKNLISNEINKPNIEKVSINIDSRELNNMKKNNKNEISKNFADMINKLDIAGKVMQELNERMSNIEKQLKEVNNNKIENKENKSNNFENLNKDNNNNYYNTFEKKNENDNPVEIFEDVNNHVQDIRQEVMKNSDYNLK